MPEKPKWAKLFRKRCRGRITKRFSDWGRCDLQPHSTDIPHCLERGMYWVRWFDAPTHIAMPNHKQID